MKRNYSDKTIKLLYGRATRCAYQGCRNPLIFEDRGILSVSAQIAHIRRSESPGGPRYDPAYPMELVDQEENLLLLCGIHHKPVDDHASVYPVAELLEWKRQQVSAGFGSELSEREVAEIIRHYDLNSLEPMTFEMLCQALTAKRFGPRTRIHGGYGPDGGRDASFDGRLADFPSAEAPWEGYVVMQAMFKTSGANTPAAAAWMRDRIRREIQSGILSSRRRVDSRPVDYLVLATNISVQAAFGSAGMYQLNQMIADLSDGNLKELVIWDEAQLFAMLDAYTDVRDAFTPLMSSSRIVVGLMDSLRGAPGDPTARQ
ncbi:hypothetical protein ACPPVO_58725 [Dactylosporangium sp. McL0621]|uniref:hypothetical protein n=1 Tax=Dactylosporangium sp. McL0621 TaxID=3415678 RepID=UPI003CF8BCB7